MNKPIRNINTLNRSIRELRDRQKAIEEKLDHNFQDLKGNYFNMTLNSILGGRKSNSNFWADLVGRIMESEKLQSGIGSMVSKLADKLGDVLKHEK